MGARFSSVSCAALAALAAAGLAPGCGGEPGGDAAATGVLQSDGVTQAGALRVEPAVLQLDPIAFGGRGKGSYELRNTGTQPLTLTRIGPLSCGCESVELELPQRQAPHDRVRIDPDGMVLALDPGERAVLHLTVDTARFREPISRRIGSFAIHHDGGDALLMEYGVDVFTPFQLEPWSVDLGTIGARERAEGAVTLLAHDVPEFGLELPDQVEGWLVRKERIDVGGVFAWRILVTAPPELPYGPFQREFRFQTDLPDAPPVRFWVMGRVEPDLAWAPKRLLLRGEPGHPIAQAVIEVRTRGLQLAVPRIEIETEAGSPPPIEAKLETLTEGRRWRLHIERLGDPPAAIAHGTVRVHTGHAEQPLIEVAYTLFPAPGPTDDGR